MSEKPFRGRKLRICVWNLQERVVSATNLKFEQELRHLSDDVETVAIAGLNDPHFTPCDLVIITADHVPEEEFVRWLDGLSKSVKRQGAVWVPALIIADVSPLSWRDSWLAVVKNNWYFDIITTDALASIPIRVANLLRIHDHLHELSRYAAAVDTLQGQVRTMELRLNELLLTARQSRSSAGDL
jgi:hypothetical protein